MNIRKPTDYSAMYAVLDQLMETALPQVELYFEMGRVICARSEKGAAVAASEYLQATYPDATGFFPRNLRRMREFFRTYENNPKLEKQAMRISWTQNVVILGGGSHLGGAGLVSAGGGALWLVEGRAVPADQRRRAPGKSSRRCRGNVLY